MRRFTKNLPELVRESSKIDLTDSDVRYLLSPSRWPRHMDLVLMNEKGQFQCIPYIHTNTSTLSAYQDGTWVPVGYIILTPDDTDAIYNQNNSATTDIISSGFFAGNPGVTIAGLGTMGAGGNLWDSSNTPFQCSSSFSSEKNQIFNSYYISYCGPSNTRPMISEHEYSLPIYEGGGSSYNAHPMGIDDFYQYSYLDPESTVYTGHQPMYPTLLRGPVVEDSESVLDRLIPSSWDLDMPYGSPDGLYGPANNNTTVLNVKFHGLDAEKYYTGELKESMTGFRSGFGGNVDWFVPSAAEMKVTMGFWKLIMEQNVVVKSSFPDQCATIPTLQDHTYLSNFPILLTCSANWDSNPLVVLLLAKDDVLGASLISNASGAIATGLVWPMAHLPLDRFI